MVKIERVFELADDLQTLFFSSESFKTSEPQYNEVYANKIVINAVKEEVFVLRSQTFYEIVIGRIPSSSMFVLADDLVCMGLVYTYNPKTQRLFIYNGTENHIYIEKGIHIGDIYDR